MAKTPDEIEHVMNEELKHVSDWFRVNKLTLNSNKTKFMMFASSKCLKSVAKINITVENEPTEQVDSFKYLGVILDRTLSFADHIAYISKKMKFRITMLGRASK